MNILFLVKFYEPFDRGGSEWSTHDLAKLLTVRGHRVTILTPNYGAKREETLDGIEIKRFSFIKKLKNPKAEITPWWTNNLIWFLYTSLICTFYVFKEKYDVIHAHSNEFLPAAVIAGAITKKKTIATFRDYQTICSFGFCLWHREKACNFTSYLKDDFEFFYQNYISNKNQLKYAILYLAAIRSWIVTKLLFYFATKVRHKIAVSKQLANIFEANGIGNMITVHNAVIVNAAAKKPKDEIAFIGKFSKGKGPDLFLESVPRISSQFPNLRYRFVGSGILEDYLREKTKEYKLQDKVIFTGRVPHEKAIQFIAGSSLVVVPSIWPEPLPRSVIETILVGTPVVATNVGGIGEVLRNNVYGLLTRPDQNNLEATIIRAIGKRDAFRKNISKELKDLKEHFTTQSVQKYLQIYQTK